LKKRSKKLLLFAVGKWGKWAKPQDVEPGRVLGLDVLRALAILLVIAAHYANNMSFWYGLRPPQGVFFCGDLGVDLFFALSGFLIGRILIDITACAPTWRNLKIFLVRRWMRTFPVYFAWLLVLAVFFPPSAHLGRYLARFATFTQNFVQPMPTDYWYGVTWSLTIEEWFYLLFGTAAIASAMLIRRSWSIWLPIGILLVIPPLLRLLVPLSWFFSNDHARLVPFLLNEIAPGVVIAWLYKRGHGVFRRPRLAFLAGVFFILAAWTMMLPIPFWIIVLFRNDIAILGCALCIPAALCIGTAPGWLDFAARYISRLSYPIYLVHETVMIQCAQRLLFARLISAELAIVISVVGMIGVAELMSRCIEKPIMRRRPRQQWLPADTGPGDGSAANRVGKFA